ncbi:MAG TPA: rRNA cytosine-C5-methyltransferase [Planctomycetaceae bacterium]|nr:rRNA cytosine-C5-methyltransferase [Planctomycetaceae bacterium]HRF02711.1 RsmB/NOP family class I SAM-dependent RNA methyltransferase [Pirellulaceae bacterium]
MSGRLPEAFVERLTRIVAPADLDGVIESFAVIKPVWARLNPLRAPIETTLADPEIAALEPVRVPGHPTAVRFDPSRREALTRSAAASDGRLYVQSLSSQCAAPILGPHPEQTVLDLAAAPGGKTLHLAALMENRGRLSAVERVRERMFRLARNLKLGGVTIAKTYLMDGRDVARKTPDRFDRVLLDAPCSSEARLRVGDEESLRYWSPRKIAEQSRKQLGLLTAGLVATRPGGRLLYATCSLAPEENERTVAGALEHFGGRVELLPFEVPAVATRPGLTAWEGDRYDESLALTRRILPNAEVDGFYLALMTKHG